MIKLLLLCGWASALLDSSPIPPFEVFDDSANEAEVIEALLPARGIGNLGEKRVPVIRLTVPAAGYLGLHGTRNLAERAQVPREHRPDDDDDDDVPEPPGARNLAEKALPEEAVMLADDAPARHPKSEVEELGL